jgi:tRNA pseudouridine38-40 synthase
VEAAGFSRSGDRLCFSMTANAFLGQQVRRTVGALLQLGRGKLTAEQFASLVEQGGPGAASWVVPARGLCLTHIDYGEKLRFLGADDEDVPG